MRSHFWPFTAVLRKIWPGVTRKVWIFPDTTDQRTLRIGERSPRRPSLPLSAASRNASRDAQSSNIEIGSRQAAANYRPAACASRKIISATIFSKHESARFRYKLPLAAVLLKKTAKITRQQKSRTRSRSVKVRASRSDIVNKNARISMWSDEVAFKSLLVPPCKWV